MSARQSHLQENYNDGLHSTVLWWGYVVDNPITCDHYYYEFFFLLRPQLDNVHLNFVCNLVGTVN